MHGLALFTVPELREWMDRRGIAHTRAANKTQLKTKIAIWVRDQVASSAPESEKEQGGSKIDTSETENTQAIEHVFGDVEPYDDLADDDSSTSSESSDEELEVLDSDTNTLLDHGDAIHTKPGEEPTSPPGPGCPLKHALQSLFGYSRFRRGQEWAIQRCMDNKRTLLVAPTGKFSLARETHLRQTRVDLFIGMSQGLESPYAMRYQRL
jgi:hypothetical protein